MKAKHVPDKGLSPEDKLQEDLEAVEELMSGVEVEGSPIIEPVTLRVRRTYTEEGDLVIDPEEEEEVIEVRDFLVEPTRTGLRLKHTLNMGQFWSLGVEVSLSVPCYREELVGAFNYATNFVLARMDEHIEKGRKRTEELRGGGVTASGHSEEHPF